MTGKERMQKLLKRQPTDRIGLGEMFWADIEKKWVAEGHVGKDVDFHDKFGLDFQIVRPFTTIADLDFEDEVIEETNETIMIKDGNGATLRTHKLHVTTPEHVDFSVKSADEWAKIKHLLQGSIDERRIDFEAYRKAKKQAAEAGRLLCVAEFGPFALMQFVSGHYNTLIGMGEDPDWVTEMAETNCNLLIGMHEMLFEREGYPDCIWYYEDLGFKDRPFMSVSMYEEMILPSHKKMFDCAHEMGLPVIYHSCGFVEPLLPLLVDAGIDCLQPIEVKAGMDVLRIYENFGDKIALMGGIDARVLITNDKDKIREELEAKIPILKQGHGYILHSDHSIPDGVEYDTYEYFLKLGLELGKY